MSVSVYAWMILKIIKRDLSQKSRNFVLFIFFRKKKKWECVSERGEEVGPSCWREYLYLCTLGAHVWPETPKLIYRRGNDILITWLFTSITKVGNEKYTCSDYKRENRKIHACYPVSLLPEVSALLHLLFHLSFSSSASVRSCLRRWFSWVKVSTRPSR